MEVLIGQEYKDTSSNEQKLLDTYSLQQSLSQAQPALSQHHLGFACQLKKSGMMAVKADATVHSQRIKKNRGVKLKRLIGPATICFGQCLVLVDGLAASSLW